MNWWVAICVLGVWCGPADPGALMHQSPAPTPDPKAVPALVAKLGSCEFHQRQAAEAALRDMWSAAFELLQEEYRATTDFEARLRIQEIVKTAFFQEELFGRVGFLGVATRIVDRSEDERIPQGHVGVRIAAVVDDTAAARADLWRDDLIVALDGRPLPGHLSETDFSRRIQQAGPGADITLGLYRQGRSLAVKVVLGQRPLRYYFDQVDTTLVDMLAATAERFVRWWPERFGTAPEPGLPARDRPGPQGPTPEPASPRHPTRR